MVEDATELQRRGLGSFTFYKMHERLVKVDTGEEWHRYYDMVNLAYLDGNLPNGEYNLTLTVMDALGQSYPPGTSITFFKDTTTSYLSRATDLDVTACPPPQPSATAQDREEASPGAANSTCGRCVEGVCVDGVCLCEADWFGEACDFDVHDSQIYIPGEHTRAPALYLSSFPRASAPIHAITCTVYLIPSHIPGAHELTCAAAG